MKILLAPSVACWLALCVSVSPMWAALRVSSGDTIAFLGDSITKQGGGPDGWCGLVTASLADLGVTVHPLNAGKGGHTTADMVARIDADVLAKKPAWMILMGGTNDNPNRGLTLDESQKNIVTMVGKAREAGIKVILATRPMRGGATAENDYNVFIRTFAHKEGIPVAEVFGAMATAHREFLASHPSVSAQTPHLTIADGTHMNGRGNQVIAESVLAALGVSSTQLAEVKRKWPDPAP